MVPIYTHHPVKYQGYKIMIFSLEGLNDLVYQLSHLQLLKAFAFNILSKIPLNWVISINAQILLSPHHSALL